MDRNVSYIICCCSRLVVLGRSILYWCAVAVVGSLLVKKVKGSLVVLLAFACLHCTQLLVCLQNFSKTAEQYPQAYK